MRRTVLDSATKEALRKAVRGLRERLLEALDQAAEGEYRLQTSQERAKLPVERRVRRERLEAWLEEQVRATPAQERKGKAAEKALHERFRREAVKEAAYTLLNRLVFVRILEHHGLIQPALLSGGWDSPAYRDEFVHYSHALQSDDTRGYAALLELLYAELALDLPGLFGPVGLTQLFPIPAASLRDVITVLNDKALDPAWGDDMTLGWVYQFWNDPEREALDRKISEGGKIEPHEIAAKTQMFTERYMVEWLLHNSLGQTWLAICAKNGWTPDFHQVRDTLDARRAEWRRRREAGEVALDALMPLESELEERWKYWVPQPMPDDAILSAPGSIRELKLIDPACGSGHFLVVGFDLLVALYEEEARHRGETWTPEEIARAIVENNLHGVDIDPRAVQLAAAGLWLKARLYAPAAELRVMNLVAPVFRLAGLPKNDPAFERMCAALDAFPVPRQRKLELMEKLAGVDHLGTLLQVDGEIEKFLEQARGALRAGAKPNAAAAREVIRRWFAEFLDAHASRAELGLRLDGEQVAAGVRFLEIVRDGAYDVVVTNPPYQGTSRLKHKEYVEQHYPRGKADLYAAFLERGLSLVREGGMSAMIAMRGWMFLSQYSEIRAWLLQNFTLQSVADIGTGAFSMRSMDDVISSAMVIWSRFAPTAGVSVALQVAPLSDPTRDAKKPARRTAALLAQSGRHEFDVAKLSGIKGTPLVYWWTQSQLDEYVQAPKLQATAPARFGLTTGDNQRFVRYPHEISSDAEGWRTGRKSLEWAPFVLGGKGRTWFEPLTNVCRWYGNGLEVKEKCLSQYGTVSKQVRNEEWYFRRGIAFAMIGSRFSGRLHKYPSVIGNMGSSVYPSAAALALVLANMNTQRAEQIMTSLNPGVHFEVGDVNRLPVLPLEGSCEILGVMEGAFDVHERHRESSIEFRRPGRSPWRYAQVWARRAVN